MVDGSVIAAAQEERFTRIKHTSKFPEHAIKYCLEEGGFDIDELDFVVFYDKPLLKFERLLESYYAIAPKGLWSFLTSMPVWIGEKLFLKKLIYDGLKKIGSYNKKSLKLIFTEHHLSHAASAYYTSSFESSAILTIDGVGEWCTAAIGHGKNNEITFLKEMNFPHSVGLLYSAFTYFLGFTVNSGEYKLMGLAPFGNTESEQTKSFIDMIKKELVQINDDGSIWMNQKYFKYTSGLKMIHEKRWTKLFGIKVRQSVDELEKSHCNLAYAIQNVTEEIVFKMASEAKQLTKSENLVMAGGVALNCVANGKLRESGLFKRIYIQPAAGDSGGALGAALAAFYTTQNITEAEVAHNEVSYASNVYLGPHFSVKDVRKMNRQMNAVCVEFNDFQELCVVVADKIANGNIVGWFQDRMEFGPRALGNRSILGDPRNSEMQNKINLKIKFREGFRPFAPAVLEEKASEFFESSQPSPYMLFVTKLLENQTKVLPSDFQGKTINEKLSFNRSKFQPITHVDMTARVQTVNKSQNPKFYQLIKAFEDLTGIGMLINTSFNVRGEPMVCSPKDAYKCFMHSDMDYMVIENFLYTKTDQADFEQKEKWRRTFDAD